MSMSHQQAEAALVANEEWCRPLSGTPLVAFAPKMVRLVRALQSVFLQSTAGMKFEPWLFPRIMPQDTLARMGWLLYHREEAMFVSRKREITYRKEELRDKELNYSSDEFPSQAADYVLDAVQCASLYHLNFGRILPLDSNGIAAKVVEFEGGWTFRNETAPTPLLRALEFLRLEFVWIGSPDGVKQLRYDLISEVAKILTNDLSLDARLFPGEACFETPVPTTYERGAELRIENIEEFPSVDIAIADTDPARRNGMQFLEIVSCGQHTELPDRFRIQVKESDGAAERAASACLGIGMTRLATAFVAKHGLDSSKWPGVVKRRIESA